MKKSILFLSISAMLMFSCSINQPSPETKLYADLCISPDKYNLPIKLSEFKEANAVIKYGTGASYAYFWYIQIEGHENTPFTPCMFPEEFKRNGMKVIISGTSYTLNCKAGMPCGGMASGPFVIDSIKQVEN
ncbi:hypothetical protein [Emticicia sp. C21]|uniref:hypothetical protein n=1 Tax=Emticicia sp. C21 TaxID=2302915 RepID=UPI000E97BBDA|nr:hypothetical protein [Emticicia sp. C21]RFS15969.1 hypothetical protein D0T08_13795 [Emticicia sp. C21]